MNWFLLQRIGFFVFLFLTIFFVVKKEHFKLVILFLVGLVFNTFYFYLGTIWFPAKMIVLGMIFMLIRQFPELPKRVQTFVALYFFVLTASFLTAVIFPPDSASRSSSVFVRLFVQMYSYASYGAIIMFLFLIPYNEIRKQKLLDHYNLIIELAVIIGLIHWICLKLGIEFMPILRQDGSMNEEVKFSTSGGEFIDRIYGFAGEPKNLAFLILPYIFISVYYFLNNNIRKNNTYHLGFLFLAVFVLINTYSSAALLAFFMGIIAIPAIFKLKIPVKMIPVVVIFILCYGAVYFLSESNNLSIEKKHTFAETIYERTFVRANEELEDDRQETVVFGHFTENSHGYWFTGYGPGMYNFHVPGQGGSWGIIPMQSGLVLMIVDFGIFGVLFFFGMLLFAFRIFGKNTKNKELIVDAFLIAFVTAFICNLMFNQITQMFYYFAIALWLYYKPKSDQQILE